jgi:NAD(P)-dependent dehydrogenase (short-subunit alcohol dehydrogenase family)
MGTATQGHGEKQVKVDLTNKTALVTGASSGLGRHFARVLAGQGARVALAARRVAALAELAAEIKASGGEAFAVALDVRDEESVATAIGTVESDFGGIDIVINNSGVSGIKPSLKLTGAEWDDVLDTNLKGAFMVAAAAARAMVGAGRPGSIINIASILGLRVAGLLAPYAASKAGLIHLTRSLALDWARYGIRVNAIAPGYFRTDINDDFWDTEPGKAMLARIPQRRLGELANLDGPLLLLASDAGAYMTGVTIPVDGGHLVSTL